MKVTSMTANSMTILAETQVEAMVLDEFLEGMNGGTHATIGYSKGITFSDGRVSRDFFITKPKPEDPDQ